MKLTAIYKCADDLVVGDVWTERHKGVVRRYRVLGVRDGPAPATTLRVIAENLETGKRRATYFFRINRVEVVAE
jgi:hypothetical protein